MKATPEGTLNYTYDTAGNLASMTSSDGNVSAAYTWDELNRLSTVVDHRLNGSNTTTYTYDAANNLATATYPNGVQATFSYDTLNRLTGQSSRLGNYSYQLGPTGNRTSGNRLSTNSTISFNGDDLMGGESYDANGNVTTTGGKTFT
jgi:YD repeat-containing protein